MGILIIDGPDQHEEFIGMFEKLHDYVIEQMKERNIKTPSLDIVLDHPMDVFNARFHRRLIANVAKDYDVFIDGEKSDDESIIKSLLVDSKVSYKLVIEGVEIGAYKVSVGLQGVHMRIDYPVGYIEYHMRSSFMNPFAVLDLIMPAGLSMKLDKEKEKPA